MQHSANSDREAAEQARRDEVATTDRQEAVRELSRCIYERRVRSELLASGIREPFRLDEIKERKRLYDEAYANWNTNHQANLFLIRQVLNESRYEVFQGLLESRFVTGIFKPLDACLTAAYLKRINGDKTAEDVLNDCYRDSASQVSISVRNLLNRTLHCGYELTNVLFTLSTTVDVDSQQRPTGSSVNVIGTRAEALRQKLEPVYGTDEGESLLISDGRPLRQQLEPWLQDVGAPDFETALGHALTVTGCPPRSNSESSAPEWQGPR